MSQEKKHIEWPSWECIEQNGSRKKGNKEAEINRESRSESRGISKELFQITNHFP